MHTHVYKNSFPSLFLSYDIFTMNLISEYISGYSVLDKINKYFPSISNTDLSITLLSSLSTIYEYLDKLILSMDVTESKSKL